MIVCFHVLILTAPLTPWDGRLGHHNLIQIYDPKALTLTLLDLTLHLRHVLFDSCSLSGGEYLGEYHLLILDTMLLVDPLKSAA